MSLAGMRVLALETRRASEMAELIRRNGGEPFVAPSMRETPLDNNEEAFAFAERLFRGDFQMMIFLTGVGARALQRVLAARFPPERFAAALRAVTVVARGPKPAAALKEMEVPVHIRVPEPNTWRELVEAVRHRPEKQVALQEYGRSNPELIRALEEGGFAVTPVRVYQWDLPEDTGPLREAARGLACNRFAVVMFTTPFQVVHLMQIAEEENLANQVHDGLRRAVVASIGPATTEMLASYEVPADVEAGPPKMGILVREASTRAEHLLASKRLLGTQSRGDG
jgi:uroporphyrinogen-III synthase